MNGFEEKRLLAEILKRPEMFAQNVASFEDQIGLLLSMKNISLHKEYSIFTMAKFKTNGPASQFCLTFDEMSKHFKDFFKEISLEIRKKADQAWTDGYKSRSDDLHSFARFLESLR